MVQGYVEISMQLIGIGLVIVAAGLWARSGVASRPKHTDEQTLIGGTIWSQIIIPVGLMISRMLDESIDFFVEAYYLVSGIILLCITGVILIVHESRRLRKIRRRRRRQLHSMKQIESQVNMGLKNIESKVILSPKTTGKLNFSLASLVAATENDDRTYYEIGIVCVMAGVLKMCELIIFVILDTKLP